MNNQQIFDIVGLITSSAAIIFRYFVLYFFLRNTLDFIYRPFVYVLATAFITVSEYLYIKMTLPVYLQILIDNMLWLLTIFFICKGNFLKKLYAFIIYASTTLLTSIAFISLDYKISTLLINKLNIANAGHVLLLFAIDLARDFINLLVLYLLLSRITKLISFSEITLNKYQGIYLLVPNFAIYSMAVLFYIVQKIRINNQNYYLLTIFPEMYYVVPLISVSLLISLLIIAFIFRKMVQVDEIQQNNLIMEQQFKQQLNHSKSVEELYNSIRSINHDMKNHILCIRHLAEENSIGEIEKYLGNMENMITKPEIEIKTGNTIADAVINEKYMLAKKQGIKFEQDFVLPGNDFIEPMDLCVILGNVLDNSIEACARITDSTIPKEISVKAKHKGIYLIMEISNSTVHKIQYLDNRILSKKSINFNYGIGISNIKAAVKKYDGVIDIVEEKNKFTLNLMLKINKH